MALTALEEVPATHFEHEVWFVKPEYVPGMHAVQLVAADGAEAAVPAAQAAHVELEVALTALEEVPATHFEHEVWPPESA